MSDHYQQLLLHMREMVGPWRRVVGWQVEALGEGYARLSLAVEERHLNPEGSVNGGVLCTLVDMAACNAVRTLLSGLVPPFLPTLELNISFLRPARGPRLVAEGRALHKGRSVAVGEVSIYADGPKPVAQGRAIFLLRGQEPGGAVHPHGPRGPIPSQ